MYKNAAKYAQHFREVTGKSVSSTGPANSIKKRKPPKENTKTSTQPLATLKPAKRLKKPPMKKQITKQDDAALYKQSYTGPTAMQMAFMCLEDKIRNTDTAKTPTK
jgi:hypothetical protein